MPKSAQFAIYVQKILKSFKYYNSDHTYPSLETKRGEFLRTKTEPTGQEDDSERERERERVSENEKGRQGDWAQPKGTVRKTIQEVRKNK